MLSCILILARVCEARAAISTFSPVRSKSSLPFSFLTSASLGDASLISILAGCLHPSSLFFCFSGILAGVMENQRNGLAAGSLLLLFSSAHAGSSQKSLKTRGRLLLYIYNPLFTLFQWFLGNLLPSNYRSSPRKQLTSKEISPCCVWAHLFLRGAAQHHGTSTLSSW